jgi:hypothetical protein
MAERHTMTYEEEIQWGTTEAAARIADLAVRSAAGLKAAQDNAERRRKEAGLSRSRAAALVIQATREKRRQGAQL